MSVTTFFPAAGANTPCDGDVTREGVNETFSTITGTAVGTSASVLTGQKTIRLTASSTTDQYSRLSRFFVLWDTSSLDGDVVDSADVEFVSNSKSNALGSPDLDIVSSAPANTNNLVIGDYDKLGHTPFASMTFASINSDDSTYNVFSLSAAGISNIDTSGISEFGASLNWDTDNSFGGTWASGSFSNINVRSADESGTSKDPKLVVTHSPAATGHINLLLMGVG